MEARASVWQVPPSWAEDFNKKIDDALEFIKVVHEVDSLVDPSERSQQLQQIGDEILRRNEMVLFQGVLNDAVPFYRKTGSRWFDELGWSTEDLDAAVQSRFH